jgi:light-regulated signal transduction histidine kinase (bacteriophytochrome)
LKYHTGESARVEIEGKEEAEHFTFSVRDNGIGIKPIFFEKIFVLVSKVASQERIQRNRDWIGDL